MITLERKNFTIFLTLISILILVFTLSCDVPKDFDYGIKKINETNNKYGVTLETYPKEIEQLNLLFNDLTELKKINLTKDKEPFNYLIDYRIKNIEAEKLYIASQKYGIIGTTKDGFGCKSRPFIIESAQLRNLSALNGFEAIQLLQKFIDEYPSQAKTAGFSQKNVLFGNATFSVILKDAIKDNKVINNFCPKNVTLEIYQKEFKKKTNLSEDYINNLSYDEAVNIWKKIRSTKY